MDREKADQQEKILEQAQTIRNLQNHSKYFGGDFPISNSLLTPVLSFSYLLGKAIV